MGYCGYAAGYDRRINVPTILILGGTAIRCLNDYVESRKRGENPVFHAKNIGIKEETDFWK